MNHALAIDIGGTKIAAALVDEAGGMWHRRQRPTPVAQGRDASLAAIRELAAEVVALAQERGPGPAMAVGMGTGGQVDPHDGRIVYATPLLPGWTGLRLRDEIASSLGLPAAVANDVHAMGLGEATHGAGRGYRQLLCLAVGTGIGGAYLADGRLQRGAHGGAGLYGHVSIDALSGRRCTCGGVGCVEAYAAGPAIVADWIESVGSEHVGSWLGIDPSSVTLQDISALVGRKDVADKSAHDALYQAGRYLGFALVSLLHALDPEAVVVGGGVAQVGEPFFSGVREEVRERAMPTFRGTPILPAALGPDAALIGAAVLAFQTSG